MSDWFFDPLPMFSYGALMIDVAWNFDNWSEAGEEKNAKAHYDCMTMDEVCAMPVGHLAASDCWIWIWATHPMLDQAFVAMNAWGFKFVTSGTWSKRNDDSGKLAFGPGYVLRCSSEPFLLAKVGNPPTFSKSVRTLIEGPRRAHSEKPENAYSAAEKLFGPVRKADIFTRKTRPGWDAFGDQSTLFDDGARPVTKRERIAPQQEPAAPMPLFPNAA